MGHRPYPRIDRARHQVERHDDEAPPLSAAPTWQPSPFEQRFLERASAMLKAASPSAGQLLDALAPFPRL